MRGEQREGGRRVTLVPSLVRGWGLAGTRLASSYSIAAYSPYT